jgi:hypothetical protein
MNRTLLVILTTSLAATAGEAAPKASAPAADAPKPAAGERSASDLLGGATWSERRLELMAGLPELEVDGVSADQRALYVSATGSLVSGYASGRQPAFGGILGWGASLKGWVGNDDVDVRAIAPFVLGIGGAYATLSPRTRLDLTARFGPGLAYVDAGRDAETSFAWTWGLEAAIALTSGDNAGLGVGVGYESIDLGDVEQDGVYVALRFGF